MSNKFEIGKTYVVLKDFYIYLEGQEFTVEKLRSDGDVSDENGYCLVASSRLIDGYVKLKQESNMNNTITQLEQQALDLQKKLDEMKATIEQQKKAEQESKKKENVFGLGGIKMDQQYHYIAYAESNKLKASNSYRGGKDDSRYKTAFNDKARAEAIAEAFNVLLELRACDGVVSASMDEVQHIIELTKDGQVCFDSYSGCSGFLSPFFDTEKSAEDALNKVGKERVRKAFLAMQGTFN